MTTFTRLPAPLRRFDPAVTTAFALIVVLLLVGSIFYPTFCPRNI